MKCSKCHSKLYHYKIEQTDKSTHRCSKCGARYRFIRNCLHYVRTVKPEKRHSIFDVNES